MTFSAFVRQMGITEREKRCLYDFLAGRFWTLFKDVIKKRVIDPTRLRAVDKRLVYFLYFSTHVHDPSVILRPT